MGAVMRAKGSRRTAAYVTKVRPILKRALRYSPAKWRAFDRMEIDPKTPGQTGLVAAILCTNVNRVYAAIKAVGNRAGDIRKYLAR